MSVFPPYSRFYQPKIDYTEQKRAYDIVFSNHIDNKKGAQQVGLGYHEVFGLVQWPKKIVTKKTAILSCFLVTIFLGPLNQPKNFRVP